MRINNPVFRSGVAVTVIASVMSVVTPAAAQGFLESLFGAFTPKPQPQRQNSPPQMQSPRASGEVRTNPFDSSRKSGSSGGGGRYKTMCVRLCDGFYFPISNGVPRRNFYRDAEMCQSQCDSETRLFFMSKSAGSIEQARDQSGLNYKRLPNAFAYRKKLDKSCACRAKPWSEAERSRHNRYAMIEAGKLDPKAATLEAEAEADADETAVAKGDENAPQITPAVPRKTEVVQRSRAIVARQGRRVVKKPKPQPTFGLGALFSGGGKPASTKMKRYKRKLHWPGDDGS